MKLLDTSEVCGLLGISRSTLYRWCNMSEEYVIFSPTQSIKNLMPSKREVLRPLVGMPNDDEAITDFPRPFKIGRALKWRDDEIMQWLESRRI